MSHTLPVAALATHDDDEEVGVYPVSAIPSSVQNSLVQNSLAQAETLIDRHLRPIKTCMIITIVGFTFVGVGFVVWMSQIA